MGIAKIIRQVYILKHTTHAHIPLTTFSKHTANTLIHTHTHTYNLHNLNVKLGLPRVGGARQGELSRWRTVTGTRHKAGEQQRATGAQDSHIHSDIVVIT